ncbi:hypothetical protein PGT21_005983 [Puccinia graminis f. sp. tritici]|uniref:Uncharacterized protein n=1 Tax=Puccinia graminis f. sp. tritici TaxID=56615 RepID=A0A5B0R079_PUCGR|nr:hypothetical protein PGT21_005983 [Puccinia graminis f. sp. tritici]
MIVSSRAWNSLCRLCTPSAPSRLSRSTTKEMIPPPPSRHSSLDHRPPGFVCGCFTSTGISCVG